MGKDGFAQSFLIRRDGFHGHLFLPHQDKYPGLALLVLGGGGMPYSFTRKEADAFSEEGISSLAVGYFGVKDAPKTIVHVPIEYVEKAAAFLHAFGYAKVIAGGISKGSELALTAASFLPDIDGVIAFAPSCRVYMGIGSGISWVDRSSWTFRGVPLSFAYHRSSGIKAVLHSLKARELTFRPVYEKADQDAEEGTIIPVERIHGPLLLIASSQDSLWSSENACRMIRQRLIARSFRYPVKTLIYPYASHILLPFESGFERFFRVARKHPEECRQTILDVRHEVFTWLSDLIPDS